MSISHPLSQPQQLMWMGQQRYPDSALYTMAMTFAIDGALDAPVFVAAFDELVRQEDVLRMIVVDSTQTSNEQTFDVHPRATYRPDVPRQLEFVDLRSGHLAASLDRRMRERCRRRLDLCECSYDSALYQIDDQRWVWFLAIHHIACDITSFSLLQQRLGALYTQLSQEVSVASTVSVSPLFSEWIAHPRLSSGLSIDSDDKNIGESVSLDEVHKLPLASTTASERASFTLSLDVHNALVERTKQLDALSVNAVLLASLNVVSGLVATRLYGLGDDESDHHSAGSVTDADCQIVCVGTPITARVDQASRNQCGPLLHLANIQTRLDSAASTVENTRRALAAVHACLQRELANGDAYNNTPLSEQALIAAGQFSIVNNVIAERFKSFNGLSCRAHWVHCDHHDAAHPLRLNTYQLNDGDPLTVAIDMNRVVFDETLRRALPGMINNLLATLLTHNVPLNTLSVADRASDSAVAIPVVEQSPGLLLERIYERGRLMPEAVALCDGERSVDYSSLMRCVDNAATTLVQRGVKPGGTVLMCLPRNIEAVVTLLAIWRAQAAFVPVDTHLPIARLKHMVSAVQAQCQSAVVAVTEPAVAPDFAQVLSQAGVIAIDNKVLSTGASEHPPLLTAELSNNPNDPAYVLFTSGSTGLPKGVVVNHGAIANYINWADSYYVASRSDIKHVDFALFTSLSVDLTLTSILLPLVTGGTVRVYLDNNEVFDTLVRKVVSDGKSNFLKLTPSHIDMLTDDGLTGASLQCVIVGGERFARDSALHLQDALGPSVVIYNEYGPTEATVGCTVHRFDATLDNAVSVPIGQPVAGAGYAIVDRALQPVPPGVRGELLITGCGLADAYLGDQTLTSRKFIHYASTRAYRSGDLASQDDSGVLHCHGRIDSQVKLRGIRLETGEIEAALNDLPWVKAAVARVVTSDTAAPLAPARCERCTLPENYPNAELDDWGICLMCRQFDRHKERIAGWFGDMQSLVELVASIRARMANRQSSEDATVSPADCVALYSGGKNSSFMLYRLKALGLTPLVLTLDNGYLSQHALANVQRTVSNLALPHRFVGTPHMASIFADSLVRHRNVCTGCFKTIYTLALQEADKAGLDTIFTGLSRGQLFETRLDDLYDRDEVSVDQFDRLIETARAAYHANDDTVTRCLGTSVLENNLLSKIRFVDFYRFVDVSPDDVMTYLAEQTSWQRPPDAGRSTNCLINEAGIYAHKQTRGYHNYDLPYSWDVRIGHKTREQALDELTEVIDPVHASALLREVGYTLPAQQRRLVAAIVTADGELSPAQKQALDAHLAQRLPAPARPASVTPLRQLPLAPSGKLDEVLLAKVCQPTLSTANVAAKDALEANLLTAWRAVFANANLGVTDDFFALGGDSLLAVRLVSSLRDFGHFIAPTVLFEYSTVRSLAQSLRNNAADENITLDADVLSHVEVTLSDTELADIARDIE